MPCSISSHLAGVASLAVTRVWERMGSCACVVTGSLLRLSVVPVDARIVSRSRPSREFAGFLDGRAFTAASRGGGGGRGELRRNSTENCVGYRGTETDRGTEMVGGDEGPESFSFTLF